MFRYSLRTLMIVITAICLLLGTLIPLASFYGAGVYAYAFAMFIGLAIAILPVVYLVRNSATGELGPVAGVAVLCAAIFLSIVNRATFTTIADGNIITYLIMLLFSGFGGLLLSLNFLAHLRRRK